jgi:Zn finger protein HypA/HybF involved in hydrogenase expression
VDFRAETTTCVSCHRDVHLGQVGAACENCHSVQKAAFGLDGFTHAKTSYPLTGRHETVACALCHKPETGTFAAGRGTAVRLTGLAAECRACHADVHLGQIDGQCEACHTTRSFRVATYRHRSRLLLDFFAGRHVTATCEACHKPVTGQFPAGRGTAILFKAETRCVACHTDVHRGSLGSNCVSCHRL